MRIFEWWGDRSPIIRYGVAFALLAISTALYIATNRSPCCRVRI